MWYLELIISIAILAVVSGSIYFSDLASDDYAVNYEAIRLVSCLKEVQNRSRSIAYMGYGDYQPSCSIYKDKYRLNTIEGKYGEDYYLPNGVKIDNYTSANYYTFRQISLYNALANKTLKVYKNNAVRYIIINRVGRIRISKVYVVDK